MPESRPICFAHSPPEGDTDWSHAHRLEDHLRAVGDLAAEFAAPFGLAEVARLAGRWHDLGKATPAFQAYIRPETHRLKTSHRNGGAIAALELLGAKNPLTLPIALAIAGHHAGLPAWPGDLNQTLGQAILRQEHPEWLAGKKFAGAANLAEPPFTNVFRTLEQGDWDLARELATRFLFSALVDADWTDTARFYGESTPEDTPASRMRELSQSLDQYLDALMVPDTPVNQQRHKVLQACRAAALQAPGIFTLTVPTGGGKTLSSLSFALRHAATHGLRRVVLVVPFTSIIEQNAQVIRRILGDDAVLEHHSALDLDQETARQASLATGGKIGKEAAWHRWKLRSETWTAPIIITTAVQFLETLHSNRPARVRKLHRLANSVVILDEAQALPLRLLEPTLDTLRVLSRAFKTSLVCCTATQPAVTKTTIDCRPLERLGSIITPIIADPAALFQALRRVQVEWPTDPDHKTTWDELATRLHQESRVLVIVHRRQDARLLAERLGGDWIHLSATMNPAHRLQVLNQIREKLKDPTARCQVISTQLIEAGVDVDFPVVYRALAGLDSLAQAAGRCNREGKMESGRVVFFHAETQPPSDLAEALNVALGFLRRPVKPDLMDPTVYPAFFQELGQSVNTDLNNLSQYRKGFESNFPALSAEYRIIDNDDQLSVIVPWPGLDEKTLAVIERAKQGFADAQDFRRLQRTSVGMSRRLVLDWVASGQVLFQKDFGIFILMDHNLYHPRFGLGQSELRPTDLVL